MNTYEYNRELHMQVIAEEEREEGERETVAQLNFFGWATALYRKIAE